MFDVLAFVAFSYSVSNPQHAQVQQLNSIRCNSSLVSLTQQEEAKMEEAGAGKRDQRGRDDCMHVSHHEHVILGSLGCVNRL